MRTLERAAKNNRKEKRNLRDQIRDLEKEIEDRENQARGLENRNLDTAWVGDIGPSVSDLATDTLSESSTNISNDQENENSAPSSGDEQQQSAGRSATPSPVSSGSGTPRPDAAGRRGSSADDRDRIPNFNRHRGDVRARDSDFDQSSRSSRGSIAISRSRARGGHRGRELNESDNESGRAASTGRAAGGEAERATPPAPTGC